MSTRKICVITGSRADYGLLSPVMEAVRSEPTFTLYIIAAGMHLSPAFGLTVQEIEKDGFFVDGRVDMNLNDDSAGGVTHSLGLGVIGFGQELRRLQPDLLMLLGDRFEILAAAQAALIARVPVAHIAGGDTTEGAFDEAMRHSITKMAHLHFVTNEIAAKRVRQLGENPAHVYNVGSPGIDVIKRLQFMSRAALEKDLDFKFLKRNLLVTFHPVTLDDKPSGEQCEELFKALDRLGNDIGIIFTMPNADTEGLTVGRMIADYASARPHVKVSTSLGQMRYLSAIAQVDAVVGNSSSGLYEVPSFRKPTVNIGDRQQGRLRASSVIDCQPTSEAIERAILSAFEKDCSATINPYGDGQSALRIVSTLKSVPDYRALLKKHFFDLTA